MGANLEGQPAEFGLMERARNFHDGALAKLAIRATAIGAAVGFGGGLATEMAVSPEPVGADAMPSHVGSVLEPNTTSFIAIEKQPYGNPGSAQTSGTKQDCLPKLLKPPHGITAVMYHAGVSHQETIVKASASPVLGCDNLRRAEMFRLQVKKSGHWVGFEGHWWYALDLGVKDTNEAHKVGTIDHATMRIFDECVNGRREPARVQFRNSVKSVNTGKVVAHGKIKNHPIKTAGCKS